MSDPTRHTASVAGGDDLARRRAADLLVGAGYTVSDRPGGMLILLADAAADGPARVASIREAAERASGAAIIAAMPDGATGAVLRRALRAGADGLVHDSELATMLVPTVDAVAHGLLAVPRALRRHVAPRPLSFREKQILGLVVEGCTNRQIADRLFVAESTVKTHLSSAFDKLDTRSRAEAAALILDPEEGYGLGILQAVPAAGEAPEAQSIALR